MILSAIFGGEKVLQERWEEMKSTWDDDEEEGLL